MAKKDIFVYTSYMKKTKKYKQKLSWFNTYET